VILAQAVQPPINSESGLDGGHCHLQRAPSLLVETLAVSARLATAYWIYDPTHPQRLILNPLQCCLVTLIPNSPSTVAFWGNGQERLEFQ
jgi:hypothetical protein